MIRLNPAATSAIAFGVPVTNDEIVTALGGR
jgi:hypothetical protein